MEALPDEWLIKDPRALYDLAEKVKVAIEAGVIEQYVPSNYPYILEGGSILDLVPGGTIPDTIHWFFRARRGPEIYNLDVDAYHGTGGRWVRIDPEALLTADRETLLRFGDLSIKKNGTKVAPISGET